jgi:hypothetical protein
MASDKDWGLAGFFSHTPKSGGTYAFDIINT